MRRSDREREQGRGEKYVHINLYDTSFSLSRRSGRGQGERVALAHPALRDIRTSYAAEETARFMGIIRRRVWQGGLSRRACPCSNVVQGINGVEHAFTAPL